MGYEFFKKIFGQGGEVRQEKYPEGTLQKRLSSVLGDARL